MHINVLCSGSCPLAWSVRYADAAPRAQTVEIDGVQIPFADLDTLIRTKQTERFQDKADVESLELVRRIGRTVDGPTRSERPRWR